MIRVALICLALAGCGTTVEVQRVEIPVPVPCIASDKIPAAPVSRFQPLAPTDPVDDQIRALLLDREYGGLYAGRIRALVEACITPETTSADLSASPK